MTPLNRIIARTNKQTGYGWAFVRTTQALMDELDDSAVDDKLKNRAADGVDHRQL